MQARLRSHLILAWGKCSVSFEANAHLCPASSYYYRKEDVTSSKSCGEGLLKYSSVIWSDECFLVWLCHPVPHWTLSSAANPESVTTVMRLQNFQNANSHFLVCPGVFWLMIIRTGRRWGSLLVRTEEKTSESSIWNLFLIQKQAQWWWLQPERSVLVPGCDGFGISWPHYIPFFAALPQDAVPPWRWSRALWMHEVCTAVVLHSNEGMYQTLLCGLSPIVVLHQWGAVMMTAGGYSPLVPWLHMFHKVRGTYLNLVGHRIKAIYEVLVSVASLTWQDMLLRASSLYPARCSQGRRVLCIFSGPKVKVLQSLLHI